MYLSESSNMCHEKNGNFVRLIVSPFLNPEFFSDWPKDCFDIQTSNKMTYSLDHSKTYGIWDLSVVIGEMRWTTLKTQNLSPRLVNNTNLNLIFCSIKIIRNYDYQDFYQCTESQKIISISSHHHKNKQNHEGDNDFVQFWGDGTKLKIPLEI